MARRIKLHIDILSHINELTFYVHRSNEPDVDEQDPFIMEVDQLLALKEKYWETAELLRRDEETPYAFHTKRHFESEQIIPEVFLDTKAVDINDLYLLSDQKMIEIHSGEIGVFDGRPVFANYEYLAMPVFDDYDTESGKSYYGPPATGLKMPLDFRVVQDLANKKYQIIYDYDFSPVAYYYRIFAKDTAGSVSPWSDTQMEELSPEDVFFRVERSADSKSWEPVVLTTMHEWFDDYHVTDNPLNLSNAEVRPLNSKEAEITFDNPWYHYTGYQRTSYEYRVRAEDDQGEHTNWLYFGPTVVYIEPEEIMIRRKLDNKSTSSKEGIDAFTVFTLTKSDIDPASPVITLIDDQLTEALKYSYTFFYTDEVEKEAEPFFLVSDHLPWKNIILFKGENHTDIVPPDFFTSFELADRVIEIGIEEGQ